MRDYTDQEAAGVKILRYLRGADPGSYLRGAWWRARCHCGGEFDVNAQTLSHRESLGKRVSCGCLGGGRATRTHGEAGRTKEYRAWKAMIRRCENKASPDYPLYGGRGITVDPAWRGSFEAFLTDMGRAPRGCSLDRIDSDGAYAPENCRWATAQEQANNRRGNVMVELPGHLGLLTVADAARALGWNYMRLYKRLHRGDMTTSVTPPWGKIVRLRT